MSWTVAIGVDTHRDIHVAVALDRLGGKLASIEVETTDRGSEELLDFARSLGEPAFVIEGTGSYGTSLTRFLIQAGCEVYECERPCRRSRRRSKSDLIDAGRAAERLVAGESVTLPRSFGEREHLKALLSERRVCVQTCTQAKNRLRALLVTAPEPIRRELSRRSTKSHPSSIIEHAERNEDPPVGNESVPLHAFPAVAALLGFPETTFSAVRGASDGELRTVAS